MRIERARYGPYSLAAVPEGIEIRLVKGRTPLVLAIGGALLVAAGGAFEALPLLAGGGALLLIGLLGAVDRSDWVVSEAGVQYAGAFGMRRRWPRGAIAAVRVTRSRRHVRPRRTPEPPRWAVVLEGESGRPLPGRLRLAARADALALAGELAGRLGARLIDES